MKRKIIFFGLALVIGLIVGLLVAARLDLSPVVQSQGERQDTSPSFEGFRMEDAVINVANTTGKAVVSISTEHTAKMRGGRQFYFGSPFGQESPVGEDESGIDGHRGVAPEDHGSGRVAFEDAGMREPGLLVGHGLGARGHAPVLGLVELVRIPDPVLGHPGRDVARAAPEVEPLRALVEADDDVRRVAYAPGPLPLLREAQPGGIGAEAAEPHVRRGGVDGLAGQGLSAGGLAVAIERDARAGIEHGGQMAPDVERQTDVRTALLPLPVDGQLEAEVALGIDAEEIARLAVLFLVDEGAPGPGIGLDGRPGLDRERVARARGFCRGPDDGSGLPVEAQSGSRYAGNEFSVALDGVAAFDSVECPRSRGRFSGRQRQTC